MRKEGVAHSGVKISKMMNKRANISYKISQPGVVTWFHNVSTSELGNGKSIPPYVGQNGYELSYSPTPGIIFLSVPSPRLWSFLSGRMNASAKSLKNWTMETFLLQWRWSRRGGRAGIGMALPHWQGFSGWFSVDWFAVYSAAIVCNVLCQLVYPEP